MTEFVGTAPQDGKNVVVLAMVPAIQAWIVFKMFACRNASLGTLDCVCGFSDSCSEGLACSFQGICEPCSHEFPGCDCKDGSCGNGLICGTEDQCRLPASCDEQSCSPNQVCNQPDPTLDASCVADCYHGYLWNALTLSCDFVQGSCGGFNDISATCNTQNRLWQC